MDEVGDAKFGALGEDGDGGGGIERGEVGNFVRIGGFGKRQCVGLRGIRQAGGWIHGFR